MRYLKETRAELRKVTWPTRKRRTNLTLIVLAVTVAMAIFLGVVTCVLAYVDPLLLVELSLCTARRRLHAAGRMV